jgi:hypothetical protein
MVHALNFKPPPPPPPVPPKIQKVNKEQKTYKGAEHKKCMELTS